MMPVSPLLMGLLGTVSVLATGVCLVLAALCKRHYLRPRHKQQHKHHDGTVTETKHGPLQSMIGSDSVIVDGHYTGLLTAESTGIEEPGGKHGSVLEDTDPDIIKNQFGMWSYFCLYSTSLPHYRIGSLNFILHFSIQRINSFFLGLIFSIIKGVPIKT